MAWTPQRGGRVTAPRSRQVNRPEYEDFTPQIETKEEEGARVVVLRLPGFLKEQMKITSEQVNNIRVQGQRPLINNRWSRFDQILPVPENCDVKKIHANFHSGVLTITMPKEVPKIPTEVPKVEKPAEQATQENGDKAVPPEAGEKAVAAAEPRAQKDQEQTADKDTKQRDEKKVAPSFSPQKGVVEPKRQKGTVEEMPLAKQREIGDKKRAVALADTPKYKSESKSERGREETSFKRREDETKERVYEKLKEPEKAEKVAERSLDKEKKYAQNGKESVGAPAEAPVPSKILDDKKKAIGKVDSCAACEEKPKDDGERSTNGNKHGIKYVAETAKQTVTKVVRKLNDEDRQLLINIGAAVLVIVVIGACVSYGFRSSTRRGN